MSDHNTRHRGARTSSGRRGRGPLVGVGAVLFAALALTAGALIARAQSGSGTVDGVAAAGPQPSADPAQAVGSSSSVRSGSATPTASTIPTLPLTPSRTLSASAAASKSASSSGTLHAPAGWRTLTMVNRLSQTIWPAIAADPSHPISATGWVLAPGASLTILIPDHWDVRMWARTGCSFDAAGDGSCVTSGCGHLQCGSTWGQFPSTLAEFNLNAWNGMDFYDVSLVEGNNLPMWVNSFGGSSQDKVDANGCSAAGCTRDANATCPSKLQRVQGGKVVACLSSCLVFETDQTCCTGSYAPRAQCNPLNWPIDSAAVFKKAEPFAYSYVDDDATSVLTCTGECDYRVTWGVSP